MVHPPSLPIDGAVAECAMLFRRLRVSTAPAWADLPDNVLRLVLRELTLDEAIALTLTCRRHNGLLDLHDLVLDPEWRGLAGTIAHGPSLARLCLLVGAADVARLCVGAFDGDLLGAMSDDARLMFAALMVRDPPRFEGLDCWPMGKDAQFDWIVVLAERAALVPKQPRAVVLHGITLLYIARAVARVNPPHLEVIEPLRILIERAMACWPSAEAIKDAVRFIASLPESPMAASLAFIVLAAYIERPHAMREDARGALLPQGVVTKVVPLIGPELADLCAKSGTLAAVAERVACVL